MGLEGKQFSHYRVLQLIGQGGMGEVYLAEDIEILRQVAIKFIRIEDVHSGQVSTSEALRLFLREAMTIARLDHPHILPLYDHGGITVDNAQFAYLVVPYRADGTLANWLSRHMQGQPAWQLTLKQVVHIITQAAQALQYAHEQQVMHLDVKPANFLVRRSATTDSYPELQLGDFGIARLSTATTSSSQHIQGTLTYMAPEQLDGSPTFASDQYALAVMTYELLTGTPPFTGTPMQVMFAHVHKLPAAVHYVNPLLPAALDPIMQKALAKKAEERYTSVAAFSQAFQAALRPLEESTVLDVQRPAQPMASLLQPVAGVKSSPVVAPYAAQTLRDTSSFAPDAPVDTDTVGTYPPTPLRKAFRRARPLLLGLSTVFCLLLIVGGIIGYGALIGKWFQPRPADPAEIPGVTWQLYSFKQHQVLLNSVVWAKNQFVAVGYEGLIFTSLDGVHWASQPSNTQFNLRSVAWSGQLLVAVGNYGTILTSQDGHSWSSSQLPGGSADLNTIVFVLWTGTQFIIVGNHGLVLTSRDGSPGSWVSANAGTPLQLWGVAWSGSRLVAVASNGTLLSSPDGATGTWVPYTTGTAKIISGVVWSGKQFVAVGFGGMIYTSSDGLSWTPYYAGPLVNLLRVAWSGSQFVVVGLGGTILTSPDANSGTWISRKSGTSVDLYSVCWSGQQFTAVGDQSTFLTSP